VASVLLLCFAISSSAAVIFTQPVGFSSSVLLFSGSLTHVTAVLRSSFSVAELLRRFSASFHSKQLRFAVRLAQWLLRRL